MINESFELGDGKLAAAEVVDSFCLLGCSSFAAQATFNVSNFFLRLVFVFQSHA